MKLKNLIIISLILTLLTISAAYASDDALTVNDENSIDESNTIKQEIEDDCLTHVEENEIGISEDVNYEIEDEAYLDDENIVEFTSYDSSQTGALKVYVDNALKYSTSITSSDYSYDSDYEEYMYRLDLGANDLDMSDYRTYNVKLTFNDELLTQANVKMLYPLDIYIYGSEYSEDECPLDGTLIVQMSLPEEATNELKLMINGKTYNINYKDGFARLSINTEGWSVGEYTAKLSYNGDSKYPYDYRERSFIITPRFTYPPVIAKGEKEFITIKSNSGTNGNIKIYEYLDDYDDKTLIANVALTNGYASYSLSNLASGNHNLYVEYKIGNSESSYAFHMEVKNNSPSFTSSISAVEINQGSPVTVKVKGPKVNSFVGIYLDDNDINSLSLSQGEISQVISGLSAGNHKINVFYDVNDQFYSNTFHINVKKVQSTQKTVFTPSKVTLMLKTVKVKKSAKKIFLTATLKVNGKPFKKMRIDFKFNGKKFKAKTNSKGVAKAKITKNFLKKLKVGKKIIIQASYGKITVKKVVKVKK